MNVLGHASVALAWGDDDPAFVLGAVLPDLASMVGVRVDRSMFGGAVGDGMRCHIDADAIFHDHPEFRAGSAALRRDLADQGLDRGPVRAVGHAGWELLLDGTLVGSSAEAAYWRALDVGELALDRHRRARPRPLARVPEVPAGVWGPCATTILPGSPSACTTYCPAGHASGSRVSSSRPSPRCSVPMPEQVAAVAPRGTGDDRCGTPSTVTHRSGDPVGLHHHRQAQARSRRRRCRSRPRAAGRTRRRRRCRTRASAGRGWSRSRA